MVKLSIAMIVKNESSCLKECLESVKDADEIVIVDTGSEDNTLEIAKQYTDKVYSGEEYKWIDDFAHSRNQARSKCTGDWILTIDADEVLEKGGIEKVKNTIALIHNTNANGIFVKLTGKTCKSQYHKNIRIYRRVPEVFYKGAIHNYLNIAEGYNSDIVIYYGYSDAHKKDTDRALRILTKVVANNPNCKREKFYLAREYYYRGNYELAARLYDYYLETADWAPEMAEAHMIRSKCYELLGKLDKAKDECLQAIKINSDFTEAWDSLANLSGKNNRAKFKEIAKTTNNNSVLFVRKDKTNIKM